MNSKFLTLAATTFVLVFFLFSCNSNGQNTPKQNTAKTAIAAIQVIQFHSTRRCVTCNLIEKLSKETLTQHFPNIPFRLINVDDKRNEKIAEEFEATGTSLFIYNPTTKKKKSLTDFAFMNAKSKPDEFKKGLKKEIEAFK